MIKNSSKMIKKELYNFISSTWVVLKDLVLVLLRVVNLVTYRLRSIVQIIHKSLRVTNMILESYGRPKYYGQKRTKFNNGMPPVKKNIIFTSAGTTITGGENNRSIETKDDTRHNQGNL